MNKIKEELRFRLQGQLSSEKTEVDVNVAYDVVEKVAVSFSVFCAESCVYQEHGWWNRNWKDEALTTEELFNIFLENYDNRGF